MEERIELSRDALADLASQAVLEVSGVVECLQSPVEALASRIKREFIRHGVKVEEESGGYRFTVHVSVRFGESIPRIAEEISRRVREYMEGAAGVRVSGVDVVVEGVDFPEKAGGGSGAMAST